MNSMDSLNIYRIENQNNNNEYRNISLLFVIFLFVGNNKKL